MGAEDDRSTAQSHSSAEPDLAAGAAPCAPEDEKPEPQAWMLSQPVLRDCNYGGAFCELLVVEAIQEYLSFHNLQDSLGALRRSLGKTGLREMFGCASESVPDVKGQSEDKGVQPCVPRGQMELSVVNALREFDEGQRDNFFQLWSGLVPPDSIGGPTGCSLELRLRVYFGIYESRKGVPAPDVYDESCTFWPEPDFTDLKAFLASKPSAAESAQSLSPLYALPFVPRPQENAALRFIFEDAWSQKLRTDVQAFLTAYASMRHAPSLRHLVGALIAAKCPKQSPPPASWHEMLRIANFGLTTANHAVQRLGKAPGHGAEQASHAKELQEWLCTGGTALPELQKQACDARRLFGSLARRPEAPPVQEPARPVGRPSIASLARALSSDLEPQGGSSPGQGVMVSQERLWPMSREALRGSSASSLNASNSNANVRRLHSARSIESRARTATALLPVPPALDFGRIASLVAEEVTEDLPSILSVLRAVLRRLALPDEPIRPRRAFLAAFACFGALRTLAMKLHEMVTGDPLHLEMSLAVMAVCACEAKGGLAFVARGFAESDPTVTLDDLHFQISVTVAWMLLGSVAFMMALFYLVNNSDPEIRMYSWQVISSTINIFCAVLIFSASNRLVEHFAFEDKIPKEMRHLHYFAITVDFIHMLFWMAMMITVLWAAARRARNHYEEEEDDDSAHRHELDVKCWAMLFAHVAGFAAINCFGDVQQLYFSGSPFQSELVVPISLSCLFTFFWLTERYVTHLYHGHLVKLDESYFELWEEQRHEAENDIAALCLSFLTCQSLRYHTGGALPDPEGNEPPLTRVSMLLFCSLCFAVIGAVSVHLVDFKIFHLQRRPQWKRAIDIFQLVCCMCCAWCSYYGGKRFFYFVWPDDVEMIIRIALGVFFSMAAFSLVLTLNVVVDRQKIFAARGAERLRSSLRKSRSKELQEMSIKEKVEMMWMKLEQKIVLQGSDTLIKAMAILVGFSWEQAFEGCVSKTCERLTTIPSYWAEVLLAALLGANLVVGRREIEAAEAQAGCISALISVANSSVRSLAHMHCLAVLQRLSLRGHLQSKMIRLGALDVVLKLLESVRKEEGPGTSDWCRLGPGDGPDTPDFSIEFTSALLMNLTLRSAGRRRCAELGAYSVLVGLIEHPNPQVRTHINGTLYTLLGVKAIRGEAQRQGAEAVFQSALERVTPENELLQRQLEFLQHQLHRSDGDSDEESEEGDPSPEGDADDGDNFLDEEELAAHFHLASVAAVGQGDGFSPAEIEANAKAAAAEAAAAEEALRCFRATPAVADAQQRRFHAFIARSCRNLMSPKRRGHSFDRMSPLSPPMLSPSSSPEPGQPAKVAEPPVTVTISPEMHEAPGLVPEAPSDKSPDPLGSLSPSTGSQPQSTSSKLEVSPQRGSAKMTEGVLMKAAEQANRSERGQRPPRQPSVDEKSPNRRPASRPNGDSEEGVGRGKGRGRGRGSNTVTKSASLPPLPESKVAGGRSSSNQTSSSRSRSEAPKRGQQAAAAAMSAAVGGQEGGFRRPRPAPSERPSKEGASLPQLPKRR
ncbi:unnamed protein product [Effrenium voratum]|nr:unnamed protein product [Effrenium voratum]